MYIFLPLGGTAGGQTLTLTGEGFSDSVMATICDQTCTLRETTSSQYQCSTPANSGKLCLLFLQKWSYIELRAYELEVSKY